jgi:hypothetical protein
MVCFGPAAIAADELSVSSFCAALSRPNQLIRFGFTPSAAKEKAVAAVHRAEIP